MNLAEAIQTALTYERRVRDIYRDGAEQAPDAVGQRVLGALAEEEQGHVDYLERCLAEWQQDGRVTALKLQTVVPSQETIEAGLRGLTPDTQEPPKRSVEIDLLKQALQAEQETTAFYERMVAELDEAGRALFEPFLHIERGHTAIVQAEIDALTGTGFWFDFPEFSLEV